MSWSKDDVLRTAVADLEDGTSYVYVEGPWNNDLPLLEAPDLKGAFFNAAVNYGDGRLACIVGFRKGEEEQAKAFVERSQYNPRLTVVEGPKVK